MYVWWHSQNNLSIGYLVYLTQLNLHHVWSFLGIGVWKWFQALFVSLTAHDCSSILMMRIFLQLPSLSVEASLITHRWLDSSQAGIPVTTVTRNCQIWGRYTPGFVRIRPIIAPNIHFYTLPSLVLWTYGGEVLATQVKFLKPSGQCTWITFCTINVFGCFCSIMAQFSQLGYFAHSFVLLSNCTQCEVMHNMLAH